MGMLMGVEIVIDKESRKPNKDAAELLVYKYVHVYYFCTFFSHFNRGEWGHISSLKEVCNGEFSIAELKIKGWTWPKSSAMYTSNCFAVVSINFVYMYSLYI